MTQIIFNKKFIYGVVIFIVALVLRLILYTVLMKDYTQGVTFYMGDSNVYQKISVNFLANHNFYASNIINMPLFSLTNEVFDSKAYMEQPITFRTPGFPLFLAFIYKISGVKEYTAIFIQIFFASLTALLTYYLANILMDDVLVSFLSGLFVAFDVISITYSSYLATESMSAFLTLLSIIFLVIALKNKNVFYMFLSSVFLSSSTYVRPITLYLPIFLVVPIIYIFWHEKKQLLLYISIFILGFTVLSGAWVYRNYKGTGIPTFSSIQGYNLYFYRAAGVEALFNGETLKDALLTGSEFKKTQARMQNLVEYLWRDDITDAARCLILQKKAVEIICMHPLIYMEVAAIGTVRLFTSPGTHWLRDLFHTSPMNHKLYISILFIELIFLSIVYFGFIYGAFIFIKIKDWFPLIILLCVIIYFTIVSSGPEANSRFRVLLWPYVAILGGYGISLFFERLRKKK